MQAMSASPFVEMSAKTVSANRETEKRDSAGSEKNFDQVLNQKSSSRPVKKPELKVTDKTKKDVTIKKFMDSFESEFQVPPTRLVEAISQLSPAELNDSAEKTAEAVIDQLNLDPNESVKAKSQYLDLIQNLNQISASEQTSVFIPDESIVGGVGIGLTQQRFQKAKVQKEGLQKSIEQMNQNFWQGQGLANPVKTELSTSYQTGTLGAEDKALKASSQDMTSKLGLENLGQNSADQFQPVDVEGLMGRTPYEVASSEDMQQTFASLGDLSSDSNNFYGKLTENSIKPKSYTEQTEGMAMTSKEVESSKTQKELLGLSALSSAALEKKQEIDSASLENEMATPDILNSTKINKANFQVASGPGLSDVVAEANLFHQSGFRENQSGTNSNESFYSKSVSKNSKETKSKGDDLKTLFAAQLGNEVAKSDLKSHEALPLIQPSKAEMDQNIQKMMNQAQYLVKKGGGEVKVKMTPEGLGDIQLKVELVNGKVQLQMLADNKETKKILESSLADLKDHLSSHKLSVESIKIDSVQGASVDVGTRNQNSSDMSQNPQSQERQNRQFWNQFQDQFGRGPQREALFENPNVKTYGQKTQTPMAPAEVTNKSIQSAYVGTSKGKGINLIA